MFSNTYAPHVGGVAHAIDSISGELRRSGHAVLIVCPEFPGMAPNETDVVRIPAVQRFNGTDFSVALPVTVGLREAIARFRPDVIHSHHPFLLGDTAVRVAAEFVRPLVFTHHTLYERYTHYVPANSVALRRFVIELGVGYGNRCGRVIAPSASIARLLIERGLETQVEIIPTGVPADRFRGDGERGRRVAGVPLFCPVIGHVGRLAPEKNLTFLATALIRALEIEPKAHVLIVGAGPSDEVITGIFTAAGKRDRLHMRGALTGSPLADAYAAMDLFAFASTSETQGLVLMEALTSGVPVVALDAPGARDVIVPEENGALVYGGDEVDFGRTVVTWLGRVRAAPGAARSAAEASARPFRIEATTARLVEVYREVVVTAAPPTDVDVSIWSSLLRRAEAEWSIWSNIAHSAIGAAQLGAPTARHGDANQEHETGQPNPRSVGAQPRGLILVQIDGLSRREFERALVGGRLPFLRRCARWGNYGIVSHFSGMPSTTPAVQGELFYGIPGCVPAFEFFERARGELVRMFFNEPASRIETRLRAMGTPLLQGGSSYSNIFSGGSAYSWCCAARSDLREWVRIDDPVRVALRGYLYVVYSLRLVALVAIELVLAIGDCLRGGATGFPWRLELLYIPTRVAIGIVLRELVTIGVRIDIARGAPIIHVNFLGYDEQAHRRGPGSSFAHWALKGIDRAISRIATSAAQSHRRNYDVWVYSDHGQEHTIPYAEVAGRPIAETVRQILGRPVSTPPAFVSETIELLRSSRARRGRLLRAVRSGSNEIIVSAMGPLGHLYSATPFAPEELVTACRRLSAEGRIPLVLARIEGEIWGWVDGVDYRLNRDAARLLGAQHPFLDELTVDLERLCRHPDAGDIVISGWRPGGQSVSFVPEWGAHGGPGARETHGFALLPRRLVARAPTVRPAQLRAYAQEFLAARTEDEPAAEPRLRTVLRLPVWSHGVVAGRMVPLAYIDDYGVSMVFLLTVVAVVAGILSFGAEDPARGAFLQIVAVTSLACALVLGVASRWGKRARKPAGAVSSSASSEKR